ncbi:hypothetical protein MPL1032_190161 [Mesorhizobium plurifarium]|uniref:Uncharacterized protein n=1 Tax=Mesorhizobium plurifarium TaxID=69974 RepID=A0A0K2VVM9_MESPL|nr:hypothetical protein MPL1032_190161 [Mesorhizobium plurifarium]
MFLYKTQFGDNPTFAPNFDDTLAHENEERQAAQDLWDTTRDLQLYKENANAEQNARAEAYDRRNKAIFDATGVQLDNPMKSFDIFRLKPEPGAGGLPESSARDDIAAAETAWQEKASALARERPQFADVIAADRPIMDDAYGIAQGAEKAAGAAQARAQAAGISPAQAITSNVGGGFAGAMRDPLQVATLFAGGGIASPARAFGWRMLETVLSEAAINGGVEAGVQAASWDWKARAGLEHSIGGSLQQVGLAALFGGTLGGLLEGGRTVFRLLGKEAPTDALERAATGTPEAGDIKTIAEAAGVKLDAESARAAELAAEQPHLDAEAFGPVPDGVDPIEAERMQASALRAADTPDTSLPTPRDPELVRVADEARSFADPVDVALAAASDQGAVYDRLLNLRTNVRQVERSLMQKYGVRTFDQLDEAPLTEQERNFLYYEPLPLGREEIDQIVNMIQPVGDLHEVALELGRAAKNLPEHTDIQRMTDSERLAVGRIMYLGSEAERLGGQRDAVLQDALRTYAQRFSDPNDAADMTRSMAERLSNLTNPRAPAAPDGPAGKTLAIEDAFSRNVQSEPLRERGATPEPASPEADESAALTLQEARGAEPEPEPAKEGGAKAEPAPELFTLDMNKAIDVWDAMPAARTADGTTLHATYETMIADADRTEFFGDLIASCKD